MSATKTSKTYLGDAVYAEVEEGRLRLTTEDGISVTNEIYLEPEVYQALTNYIAWHRKRGRFNDGFSRGANDDLR